MKGPRTWSGRRLFSYALVFSALYGLARVAGLQAHTSVLAGTHSGGYMAHYFGVVHLILHILFVGVVPILMIAGGLLWLGGRLSRSADHGAKQPPRAEGTPEA